MADLFGIADRYEVKVFRAVPGGYSEPEIQASDNVEDELYERITEYLINRRNNHG